ncbi:unnamed protein product, partial [Rotaria sp. Silwood1]
IPSTTQHQAIQQQIIQ